MDYKIQEDQFRIQSIDTAVLLNELVTRALIMSKGKNKNLETDNLLARLTSFANNVNGGAYAPKDPFELQELASYSTKVIASLLTEDESHKYLNLILGIIAPGGIKEQLENNTYNSGMYGARIFGAEYMNAINKFIEFVRISNIARVDSFDRFKSVYEKCIVINPDIDKVASQDLHTFFIKCRECGLN